MELCDDGDEAAVRDRERQLIQKRLLAAAVMRVWLGQFYAERLVSNPRPSMKVPLDR